MLLSIFRRLAFAVSSVVGISFASFVAFGSSLDPTYPLVLSSDPRPREHLQQLYHLTDPILVRYWLWVKGLFTNGFGTTVLPPRGQTVGSRFDGGTPIGPELLTAAGITLQLVAVSMIAVVVVSVATGALSARAPGSPSDVVIRLLSYVSWSLPTFVTGLLLWALLSPTGWFLPGAPGGGVLAWVRHMALPVTTLTLGLVGIYGRYVRAGMLVSLREPYAVVARGKGLSERQVLVRHVVRNSLVPFVSVVALDFGAIIGASLAADYVFGMGGLASLFLQALAASDPFQLTALIVVLASIVAVFMSLADIAVALLDPRVRAN